MNQAFPQGARHGFRARMHVQFLVNRAQVKADRMNADAQFPGSRLILVTLGK
jgi:hypothetical protein